MIVYKLKSRTANVKILLCCFTILIVLWYFTFKRVVRERDGTILIYNKIPKTGSTSFMQLAYKMSWQNKFNIIYMNTSFKRNYLSPLDQLHISKNISNWLDKTPILYHGHFSYFDIKKFGFIAQGKRVLYINVLRDPLDRFISYYYFLRYGDNFRPHLKRHRSGKNQTLDECIAKKENNCELKLLWMQIPFFCGHYYFCRDPGNDMALQMAKHNLATRYFIVGTTERLLDFVLLLEHAFPTFFHGAHNTFLADGSNFWKRKTNYKVAPKRETLDFIKSSNIWKMENEFYQFASAIFDDYFALSQRYNFKVYDLQRVYQKIKIRV